MIHSARRHRHILVVVCLLLLCVAPWMAVSAQPVREQDAGTASVPLSALALEEATVTVTVLEDPLRPLDAVLEMCGSIEADRRDRQDSEITEHMRRLCRTIERFAETIEPPPHALRPDGYLVTIPLREPVDGIRAVLWRSTSLDEAMVFLDLLRGETLRGVTVYRRNPPSSKEAPACAECPIKDLVFSAANIQEDPRVFE